MAIGDIGAAVIDTLTLRTTGLQPSICRVYGSVYAVAYTDTVGIVTTFSIDEDGNFSAAIDSLTFEPTSSGGPSIIKAHDGIFAVAYGGVDSDGFCKTFDIDNDGNIGAVLDTLEFDTSQCIGRAQNFLHISGNVFAFAYQGASSYLTIKTWAIDTAGALGSVLSTLTISVTQNKGIAFIHCTGSLYATLINQLVNDTQLDTFTISDVGTISGIIDTATLDSGGNGGKPLFQSVGGNNYALAYYTGARKVATRSISPAGTIGAEIDTGTLTGAPYSMVSIGVGVYAYASIDSTVASVRTISIAADGTIGAEVDNLGIASTANYPHIIHHREDLYACAVTGSPTNDGLVKTFTIVNAAPLPADDLSRVTGIRHIYRPGLFRMVLSLGDVSNTIEIAEHKVRRELEIPEQQTPEPAVGLEPGPGTGGWPPPTQQQPPRRPITIPITPGIVTPTEVAEEIFGKPVEPRAEPPTVSELLGATVRAAIPSPIRKLWRAITPWEEEVGETFGGEVAERFRAVTRFFGGLFR